MNTLFIVIPAFNEAENIETVVNDWYSIIENHNESNSSRLVVVNDGSKDNTYEILCRIAETKPLLEIIDKENGGHGSAVLCGYRFAVENGADFIFQTDSDGQTRPDEFEGFWALKDEYDAIIGIRPSRGDGLSRYIIEKVLCFILFVIFGIRLSDSNAPFRLMKRELVGKYIDRLPRDYFLPNVMFTTFFAYYNDNVFFKEISFECRKGGKNSINLRKIVKIGIQAVNDFTLIRKEMKKETCDGEIQKSGN